MQSDFNHIDDFFRKKEEEAGADNSMQDQHWQQMQKMLTTPVPAPLGKVRTLNLKMLWQVAVAVITVTAVTFVVINNKSEKSESTTQITRTNTERTNVNPPTDPNFTRLAKDETGTVQNNAVNQLSHKTGFPNSKFESGSDSDFTRQFNQVISTQNNVSQIPPVKPEMVISAFFNELKKTRTGICNQY